MRQRLRQRLAMLGIFAVLVHTLLAAVIAPVAVAAGTVDPFSIICHSGSDATPTDDQTPAPAPSAACDHCNVCSAAGAASTPDVVLAGQLLPAGVLVVLIPAHVAQRDGVTSNPKLARGPPQQV